MPFNSEEVGKKSKTHTRMHACMPGSTALQNKFRRHSFAIRRSERDSRSPGNERPPENLEKRSLQLMT